MQDNLLRLIKKVTEPIAIIKKKLDSLEMDLIIQLTGIEMSSQRTRDLFISKLEIDKCCQKITQDNNEDTLLADELKRMIKKHICLGRTQRETVKFDQTQEVKAIFDKLKSHKDSILEDYNSMEVELEAENISKERDPKEHTLDQLSSLALSIPWYTQSYSMKVGH